MTLLVHNDFRFECPHCGMKWDTYGKRTGFVKAGAEQHAYACEDRSPAQRRAIALRHQAAQQKKPGYTTFTYAWNHKGMTP